MNDQVSKLTAENAELKACGNFQSVARQAKLDEFVRAEVKASELPPLRDMATMMNRAANYLREHRGKAWDTAEKLDEFATVLWGIANDELRAARSPVAAPQPDVSARDAGIAELIRRLDLLPEASSKHYELARELRALPTAAPESAEPSAMEAIQGELRAADAVIQSRDTTLMRWASWITNRTRNFIDYKCVRCAPVCSMTVKDYTCVYHEASDRLATSSAAKGEA